MAVGRSLRGHDLTFVSPLCLVLEIVNRLLKNRRYKTKKRYWIQNSRTKFSRFSYFNIICVKLYQFEKSCPLSGFKARM